MSENLAVSLRDAYTQVIDAYNSNLYSVLCKGFGLDKQSAHDCLSKFEVQAYDYSVNELKLVFKS